MNARFTPGDKVAIRRSLSPGHIRTPWYVRGATGLVERVCGAFANPEELAYGRNGLPERALYRVIVRMDDIWPDYAGQPTDSLEVEVYEHWLEPA